MKGMNTDIFKYPLFNKQTHLKGSLINYKYGRKQVQEQAKYSRSKTMVCLFVDSSHICASFEEFATRSSTELKGV